MFVNNASGQRGLVCQYDVVCFDEVSGISFDQKDGVNIMKGYMESGEFSRGRESIRAEGCIVMVGNFDVDVQHQQRVGHLLSPLPPEMRDDVLAGLNAGLSAASGLHSRLADDPELAAACNRTGQWIWDLRQEPAGLEVATARASALPCRRVLAVGSDMAVGKMSACLELLAAAGRRGLDARFVGTGQAGILISGRGVALDAVRVDYAAGAVEAAVLQAAEGAGPEALVLVEGQGSLCHPGSTATLPLLRGSQPTDLLLVHRASQSQVRTRPGAVPVAIPPLPEVIAANEAIAALGRPDGHRPRVRAIALNTALLEPQAAAQEARRLAELTGLPCLDPVREGADALLEALLAP